LRHRTCAHGAPRSYCLQAFDDDLLAALKAVIDDYIRSNFAAWFDAPDGCFTVLDHEYIGAFLIRDERGVRFAPEADD